MFSYIISSMTRDILSHVASFVHTRPLWQALQEMFASQKHARAVKIRIALATTKKGALTVAEYIGKMRSLADEMAAAGKPLDDEDLVSYIVAGFDIEYNPVVFAVLARVEPITLTEHLLSFKQRMDLWQGSNGGSANVASHGGGRGNGGGRGGARSGGRGNYWSRGTGGGRGHGGFNNGRPKIKCQLCKEGGTLHQLLLASLRRGLRRP